MLKADLRLATQIDQPPSSTTAQLIDNNLNYFMETVYGNREFSVGIDSDNTLIRKIDSAVLAEQDHYNIRIARNVASFSVTRVSTWSIKIFLEIGSEPDDYGEMETISSDTMVFTAPMAG
jgi:hypothetical protein